MGGLLRFLGCLEHVVASYPGPTIWDTGALNGPSGSTVWVSGVPKLRFMLRAAYFIVWSHSRPWLSSLRTVFFVPSPKLTLKLMEGPI